MTVPALDVLTPAERFARRFRGLDRAYGIHVPAKVKDRGSLKLEGRAETVRNSVTIELFALHLSGKQGLGVIPVVDDGTCWFGAIDIDLEKYPSGLRLKSW